MTDPINNLSRSDRALPKPGVANAGSPSAAKPEVLATDTTRAAARPGPLNAPVLPDATTAARQAAEAGQDESLVLSDAAKRAMADPGFDRKKVDSIKRALQEGSYPLNARKIAENFVALERMIKE